MGKRWGGYFTSFRTIVAGVFVAVVLIMSVAPTLTGALDRTDRVADGVAVLGQDFSKVSYGEIGPALRSAFDAYSHQPIPILGVTGEFAVKLTPAELGATLDITASKTRVLSAASKDQFPDRLGRLVGRGPERDVVPVVVFDENRFQAALAKLPLAIDSPARDAELRISTNNVALRQAKSGWRVNLEATGQRLREQVVAGKRGEVAPVVDEVQPAVRDVDWERAADAARRIISAGLDVRHGDRTWQLSREELARLLIVDPPSGQVRDGVVRLDENGLRAFLESIAQEVDVAAVDARVEQQSGRFAVTGGVSGRKVDLAESIRRIGAAALETDRQVALDVVAVPPNARTDDWQAAAEAANRAISSPILLTFRDRTWPLPAPTLAAMMTFTATTNSATRYSIHLDGEQLGAFVRKVAKDVDKPARDARFKAVDGKVALLADGQEGLTVDAAATAAAIARQAFTDERKVAVVASVTKPKITAADVGTISFPDLISESTTSYAGSIPERAHNVELATERLNGTLVPPGGIFSFNESVGPTTLAAGYQIGYGITLKDGQAVTVPSEAGGICQVATTVFQAAFWGGMPIVLRQGHSYWISRYVSRDMPGLDATVDDPWLDFKFRNGTSGWLLVEASADGTNLRFALRGKKPGWEVKVDPPVISGIVKASQAAVRQEDPTMLKGKELWVEHAEDGFTSRIRRTVLDGGAVVDSMDVASTYRPSQNVLLVGTLEPTPTPSATAVLTGTVRPQPTGTVTPSPTATPAR